MPLALMTKETVMPLAAVTSAVAGKSLETGLPLAVVKSSIL